MYMVYINMVQSAHPAHSCSYSSAAVSPTPTFPSRHEHTTRLAAITCNRLQILHIAHYISLLTVVIATALTTMPAIITALWPTMKAWHCRLQQCTASFPFPKTKPSAKCKLYVERCNPWRAQARRHMPSGIRHNEKSHLTLVIMPQSLEVKT